MTEVVPLNAWREANKTMKKRPTSGYVVSHLLANNTKAKKIVVYGFDFYTSGNFYRGDKISTSHDHDDERDAFLRMMESYPQLKLA